MFVRHSSFSIVRHRHRHSVSSAIVIQIVIQYLPSSSSSFSIFRHRHRHSVASVVRYHPFISSLRYRLPLVVGSRPTGHCCDPPYTWGECMDHD